MKNNGNVSVSGDGGKSSSPSIPQRKDTRFFIASENHAALDSDRVPTSKWRGFTLVELVVVITVLAVLATIGFLSVWGYSSRARDSNRVAEIANIMKSLDFWIIASGSYPNPDNYFTVTYSGGSVWYQGTVGTGVVSQFHASISGGGLNKRPLDPLRNTEYVYSSLAFGKAYQVKADYEGDSLAWDPSFTAYAAPGNPTTAIIRGNYGGIAAKTVTGWLTYVLAVPSIISGTGGIGQLIEMLPNTLTGKLLVDGWSNVSGIAFNPATVVYSWATLPQNDSTGAITAIATNLKNAYSGSVVANSTAIAPILAATWSNLGQLGTAIVNGQLWWSASTSGNNGVTDPNAPSVTLLLHLDGTNGSTSFPDVKSNSMTRVGNAQISTAQSKFWGASLALDGAGDYLIFPSVTGLDFGTGDFTVEWWIYHVGNGSGRGTFIGGTGVTGWFSSDIGAGDVMGVYLLPYPGSYVATWGVSRNTWHHVAMVRQSGTMKFYADGNLVGSTSESRSATLAWNYIGSDPGSSTYDHNGYIDEVRVTKGLARYSGSTYTVPTAAFPDN